MASAIDATKPAAGNATTQSVRENFASAKSEIEALQDLSPYIGSKALLGVFRGSPSGITVLPNATQVVMDFDAIADDTMGIYDALTNTFTLPASVTEISITLRAEMANVASGHGSIEGTRSLILPSADGMGVFGNPIVNQLTGGGILRANTDRVPWDHGVLGDSFQIKASQTSGAEIYISGSNGVGAGQTGVIIHLYG